MHRHRVFPQIDVVVLAELFGDEVDDHLVEIVTPEVRVTVRGLHLEHAVFADFQNRYVERAATQVEHGNLLVFLLVHCVSKRCGCGLVDDPHSLLGLLLRLGVFNFPLDVEPSHGCRVDGRLPLGVVEIRRHGDDRLANGMPEVSFGGFLQLAKHHRRDFRWGVRLAVDVHFHEISRAAHDLVGDELFLGLNFVVFPAHKPLDRVNRLRRVGDRLTFRRVTDEPVAVLSKRHHARRNAVAFLVGNHLHFATFHHGHNGVGRAQVDPDDLFFSHVSVSRYW